jgi:phosphatidate cytidylyltransferase
MTGEAGQGAPRRSIWGPLGGDFGIRLASALVLFGFALLIVRAGGWYFSAWVALACAIMAVEWERMTQQPFSWAGVAVASASVAGAAALATLGRYDWAFAAAGLGALVMTVHAQIAGRHRRWAFALPLYLGIPAIALVWLRASPEGWLPTLWFLFVVWATDSWAMIAGRVFKGPLLAPRISPKKTWSGTVAGWVGAALVGLGFAIAYRQPVVTLVLFSALTAFAAQMGDIAESAIKRRAGVKDSSNLIPGHGGLLDRFDALIGASVFVLLWGLLRLPLPIFAG